MLDAVLGAIGGGAAVSIVAIYFSDSSDRDNGGCNGYHWQTKYRYSENGRYAVECYTAKNYNGKIQMKYEDKYKISSDGNNVVLKEAVKEVCEDCGKARYNYEDVFRTDIISLWEESKDDE